MLSFFSPALSDKLAKSKRTINKQIITNVNYAFSTVIKLAIGHGLITAASADHGIACFTEVEYPGSFFGISDFSLESSETDSLADRLTTNCTNVVRTDQYHCFRRGDIKSEYGNSAYQIATCILSYDDPWGPENPCVFSTLAEHCPDGFGKSYEPWFDYVITALIGMGGICALAGCSYGLTKYLRSRTAIEQIAEEKSASEIAPHYTLAIAPEIELPASIQESKSSAMESKFTCPITLVIMRDPYTADDGHTYEKSAILRHRSIKQFSPIDNITELETTSVIKKRNGSRHIRNEIHATVLQDKELANEFYTQHRDAIDNPDIHLGEIDFAKQFKQTYPELIQVPRYVRL